MIDADLGGSVSSKAATGQAQDVKPRMRGAWHAYAAIASIGTGATLVSVAGAARGPWAAAVTGIYAVTVTMMFTTSALYHRRAWSQRGQAVMKRLDHSMIYVFIAGTYTALAPLALSSAQARAVLIAAWTGATLGVLLQIAWKQAPRWLSAPCYLVLGWIAAFVIPGLLHQGGIATLVLTLCGGGIYTVGAVVYASKRPDPHPSVFGYHEVFHGCTIAAAICEYVAIWFALFH